MQSKVYNEKVSKFTSWNYKYWTNEDNEIVQSVQYFSPKNPIFKNNQKIQKPN